MNVLRLWAGTGWTALSLFCSLLSCAPTLAQEPGQIVERVVAGSPAATAGLQPQDLLLTYDGHPLTSPYLLQAYRENVHGKREVVLTVRRGEQTLMPTVAVARLGVVIRPPLTDQPLALYTSGAGLLDSGKWQEAVTAWRQAAHAAESGGDLIAAVWLLDRVGQVQAQNGQWKESVADYEAARQLAQRSRDAATESRILAALGRSSYFANDFVGATKWLELALTIDTQQDYTIWASNDLVRLGNLAFSRSDLVSAASYYKRALDIQQREDPASLDVAVSLNNLGNVEFQRGDLISAADYYQRGLRIEQQREPDSREVPRTLENLGNVALFTDDLNAAASYYEQSYRLWHRLAPESPDEARILNNQGDLAREQGDLTGAEQAYRQALAIQERVARDSLSMANTLSNLGVVAQGRMDLTAAESYHQRALQIRTHLAPESMDVANSDVNLGNLAADRGDLAGATRDLDRALSIWRRLAPDSMFEANGLSILGQVAHKQGDLAAAERHLQRVLVICQRLAPASTVLAKALNSLGEIAQQRGESALAQSDFVSADAILRRLAPGSIDHAMVYQNLGALAEEQHHPAVALANFQAAATIVEQKRLAIATTEGRTLFAEPFSDLYDALMRTYLILGQPDNAFHTLERQRARALVEMLAERSLDLSNDAPQALLTRQQQLDRQRDALYRRLATLDADHDQQRIDALRHRIEVNQAEQRELIGDLRHASPHYAALQYPLPLTASEAQRVLDPGTLLMAYSVQAKQTLVFTLSRSSLHVYKVAVTAQDLTRLANDLYVRCSDSHRPLYQNQAAHLYDTLLRPAQREIGLAHRLLLCPDASLLRLPFAALFDRKAGKHLIESKPIHYVASLSVYARLRVQRLAQRSDTRPIVAFADPLYPPAAQTALAADLSRYRQMGGHLTPLPLTRRQALKLQQLFGKRVVLKLGKQATRSAVFTEGPQASILHFACHGLLDDQDPQGSALALSPDGAGDTGLLYAYEVLEKLRLRGTLVMLAACETGLGQTTRSEGVLGLTRAFEYAGASSVGVTLWKVLDTSTTMLLDRFYEGLRHGQSTADAMRSAQLQMLSSKDTAQQHPFQWAAFVLYGDWR